MLHRLRTAAGPPQARRLSAALWTLSMGENYGAVSVPAIADGGPDNGSRPKGAASAAGTKKGSSKAKSGTAPVSKRDQVYLDAILQKRIRMFEEIQAQQAAARASVGGEAIRITLPDGTVKEGKKFISTPMDVAKEISSGFAANALIAQYLDENKQLILAILDNQNLGKLSECAQYQAQLQKNLLYLAAIADAQPQIPAVRAQVHMDMRPGMDNGMHAMHTEATFGMNNGLPTTSLSEFPKGATAGGSSDGRGNKQDANAGAELASSDGHRTSVNDHGSGDKEPSLQKRLQEGKTP